MEYKEFCEKLIERLREEKGDVFQIEMRTRRIGRTEEFLTAKKYGEKETLAFNPGYFYLMYEELQDFEAIVATICNSLNSYEKAITFEEFTQAIYLDVSAHLSNGICEITENPDRTEKALYVMNGGNGQFYNLSALYPEYLEHGDLQTITEKILNERTFTFEDLLDYEKIKGQIFLAVTNGVKKENEEFLRTVPNYSMLDLRVYPQIITYDQSLEVTHDLMKLWGISKDKLFKDAKANMPKACKVDVFHPQIVGVTNKYYRYGSGFLADERTLKDLHKRFGDFYIIPDNIHSSILMPKAAAQKAKWGERAIHELEKDVKKSSPVPEGKNLSDNIYFYDNKSLTLINTMGAYIQKQRYTFDRSNQTPKI